jgi:flagellar biogenesis protein FliO
MKPRFTTFRNFSRHTAWFAVALAPIPALADTTNSINSTNSAVVPITFTNLPDAGLSLFRVTGAFALVIGIFLAGVWVYRNWQRFLGPRGCAPKLSVLESRSLGGKHALHVIAFEQQRFLLSSSPTGVSLVSHLTPATESETAPAPLSPKLSFAESLAHVLKGKPAGGSPTGGVS